MHLLTGNGEQCFWKVAEVSVKKDIVIFCGGYEDREPYIILLFVFEAVGVHPTAKRAAVVCMFEHY